MSDDRTPREPFPDSTTGVPVRGPVSRMKMVGRPGVISVALMRRYFELAMSTTPHFKTQPLGFVEASGEFCHYSNAYTDAMWMGFAIGMRCHERVAKSKPPEKS